MNYSRVLCKYFDVEKKGYVTMGGILINVACFVLVGAFIAVLAYLSIHGIRFWLAAWYEPTSSFDPIGFSGSIIVGLLFMGFTIPIISKIASIKIAKCELKKEGGNK